MSNATAAAPAFQPVVIAAAKERAVSLCEKALAACFKYGATAERHARAKRYQIEEFQNRKMSERILCDLPLRPAGGAPLIDSREELLAAIEVYEIAGIAEVRRLFAASPVC